MAFCQTLPPSETPKPITFRGLVRVPPEAAGLASGVELSSTVSRAQLRGLVARLDRTGWFDSIRIEEGEKAYVVSLIERPFLSGVEYSGSKALRKERIEELFKLHAVVPILARPVDPVGLQKAANLMRQALQELGHPFTQVQVAIEPTGSAAAKAVFHITDGPRVLVDSVAFPGTSALSPHMLENKLEVKPHAWFAGMRRKNVYVPERFPADAKRIEEFYKTQGYLFVEVGAPQIETARIKKRKWWPWPHSGHETRLRIALPVNEGPQIRWESFAVFDCYGRTGDEILLQHWTPDSPYSTENIGTIASDLQKVLRCDSAPSEVTAYPEIDRASRSAHVSFRARPAEPLQVRRVEFAGHSRFPDRFYRRRLSIAEGDAWRPEKLEAGLAAISRDGFVKPITADGVAVDFDHHAHAVDIRIRVEEAGRQRLSLVGGAGSIGLAYNLFNALGGEELLTGYLEGGPASLQIMAGIVKDGLLGNRAGLGLSLFRNVIRPRLPGQRNQRLFVSTSTGISQTFSYRLTSGQQVSADYRLESSRLRIPGAATASGLPVQSSFSNSEVSVGWKRLTPYSLVAIEGAVSGGVLGGSQDLMRFAGSAARQGREGALGAWRARVQSAGVFSAPWANTSEVPIASRLYPAEDWVRTMRAGELTRQNSTSSSGLNLVQGANLERTFRVAPSGGVRFAAFADGAAGWLLGGTGKSTLAGRAAMGLELRYRIPAAEQRRIPLAGETLRIHYAVAPWLLSKGGRAAWGWALGTMF